jgi:DNA recombination protein RmuC
MLLVGAVAGAAVVYVLLRRRTLAVEQDFDAVSARLSDVSAQFAAADAERRLLAAPSASPATKTAASSVPWRLWRRS